MPIFAILPQKGVIVDSVNSGVSELNVTKIRNNLEKFSLFNLLKSELEYCNCNPFPDGSTTNEIDPQKNADFAILIGCHAMINRKNLYEVN